MKLAALLILIATGVPASAQVRLIAHSVPLNGFPYHLLEIDPSGPNVVDLGPMAVYTQCMTWSPSGGLLAPALWPRQLMRVDPDFSSVTSIVGPYGTTLYPTAACAHPVSGVLYVFDHPTGSIYTLDPATGGAVPTGASYPGFGTSGAMTWSLDGQRLFIHFYNDGGLFELDLDQNTATLIGPVGTGFNGGLFSLTTHPISGEVIGVANHGSFQPMRLVQVSTVDATVTDLGPLGNWWPINGLSFVPESLGERICDPAVPNSTGAPARLQVFGSKDASDAALYTRASGLPPGQFGYLLASRTSGFVAGAGGSQGDLCSVGSVARFIAQIQVADASGAFNVHVDTLAIPEPGGGAALMMGDTWTFQVWYRDVNPLPTSNFSDAVTAVFQ